MNACFEKEFPQLTRVAKGDQYWSVFAKMLILCLEHFSEWFNVIAFRYTFHLVLSGFLRDFLTSWGSSFLCFVHGIHCCGEYELSSFFRIFSPCNKIWCDKRFAVMRRYSVIDVINPVVQNFHFILHRWFNLVPSRVALNSTHVKKRVVGVQTILKCFLIASSLQVVYRHLLRPFVYFTVFTTKHRWQLSSFSYSIIFSRIILISQKSVSSASRSCM